MRKLWLTIGPDKIIDYHSPTIDNYRLIIIVIPYCLQVSNKHVFKSHSSERTFNDNL